MLQIRESDITNAYLLGSSVDHSETIATKTGTAIYRNQLLREYKETRARSDDDGM